MNNQDPRRTPSAKASDGSKDGYERAYEKQLRRFTEMDTSDTEKIDVENLSGMQYGQHPNRSRRKSSGKNSNSKKRKSNTMKSTHIDRSEPLRFGGHAQENEKAVRKGSPVRKVLLILLLIIILLIGVLQLLIFRYLGKVTYRETGERRFNTASMHSDSVLNVLLIGSDTRDSSQRGRTDSMILLSIDSDNKRTTMTSFMRDSYVMLPEYDLDGDGAYYGEGDKCKLNAAYIYGGAELLMDTIEYNFDIEVDRYVYVDFFSFIDIIDAVGGITLDITDEEAAGMKAPMYEQNKYLGNAFGTDYLVCGGKGLLVNGNQALGYARLRYVGNADFQRTQRQRTVLTKLIEKSKEQSIKGLDRLISAVCESAETNMTKWELYKLVYRAPFILKYDINELRIPGDDEYSFGTGYDGSSVLLLNLPGCIETLNREIYQ